jgi:hypothetical protein
VPRDRSFADQPGSSQGRTGLRSESVANGEAKLDTEKCSEDVVVEQDRVLEVKAKTKTEVGTGSWWLTNWTVRFHKPDHLISPYSGHTKALRTTVPGTALAARWCPPGLMHSQRRRIRQMRVQKMREEAAEKERDEHFNNI